MALKPIEIILNAKDNASKVFDGLNAKMTAIAAAIAGYFGVNAFANVITGAGNFEEAMSRVQAATNTSGAELEKLKVAAEQAGANTKFTAIEAASALENLAKAGLNSQQAIAALPAVMNMAQAGGVSLADASERLTGVVMGMGLKFEDSARVADVLAMGANASRTSITGLAEAMSYAGPIAKTVGLSLEGTVAIIAQFANAGIDASRAGTALNSILAQFADPASKFRQELLGIGISTGNFETALKQLAAAGPKGAMAIQAVGLEAGPALRAALSLGIPALEELKGKLQGAEGSAAATAKVMGENLNGALKGLSSAWDTVKNVLGTPVLPVLKSGVDELAGALRTAVENGTIAKFGTALATAFQSAVEWARQFLATVDFGKVTTDMQAFASRAGEVFDQIGQYATNAGNVVKLMYGVMSAGTNTVMAAIYGIGEAFAGVARDIMSGVAVIRDGLAKITFGGLSESFKLAAEDARLMAQGFGEASQAMHDKAVAAMDGIAAGAELANAGFTGLADAAAQTQTATDQGAQSLAAMSEAMRKESEAAYAAIEAADKKAEATNKATEAVRAAAVVAEESRARLAALRAEYDQAVALGNWQKAAELQGQINKALKETATVSKEAGKSADQMAKDVGEAYQRLGITSTETLKNLATQAKADFELIKKSGTASAVDIGKAFAAYAEKAIAANGGVATAAIKAEAALRGYKIEVDDTGQNTLKLVTATDGLAASFAKAAEAAKSKAAVMKADNDLALSGLNLRKSEIDSAIAVAQAQGKESEVIKLKIEQKKIEIAIIQATVKAQIDEAQSSISVAEAKMSELRASGSLTAEKKAELQAEIKSAQAKINDAKARGESVRVLEQEIKALQGSTSGYNANVSAINQTTAALEALNAEREREIAAKEKSNELNEREAELERKRRGTDKEGYSVDVNGNRIVQTVETQQSLYNKAKDSGLTADQSKRLADQYAPKQGGPMFDNNAFWTELNQLKQQNDLNAEHTEAEKMRQEGQAAQQEEQRRKEEDTRKKQEEIKPAPAPPALTPSPAPAPQAWNGNGGSASITPAPSTVTRTVNLNLNGVGIGSINTDASGEAAINSFMSELERSARLAGVI